MHCPTEWSLLFHSLHSCGISWWTNSFWRTRGERRAGIVKGAGLGAVDGMGRDAAAGRARQVGKYHGTGKAERNKYATK